MELLLILTSMGLGYSLLTTTPAPARYFELLAVWGTLALIGGALLTDVAPAVSLLIAGLVIAPLWWATLTVSGECARSEAAETVALWSGWRSRMNSARGRDVAGSSSLTLAERINHAPLPSTVEEIEITEIPHGVPTHTAPGDAPNLELAPIEMIRYRRGRRV